MVNTYWMAPKFNNAIIMNPLLERTIQNKSEKRVRSFFVPGQYEYYELLTHLQGKGQVLALTKNSKIQLFPASFTDWSDRSCAYFHSLISSLQSGGFKFKDERQKELLVLFIEFVYSTDSKKDALSLLSQDDVTLKSALQTNKSEPFASDYVKNQMDSEENQMLLIKSAKAFFEFIRKATIGQYFTFSHDKNSIDPTEPCDFYIIHPECQFQFTLPLLVEMNDLYGGNCALYYNLSAGSGSQSLLIKFMTLYHGPISIRLSEDSELVNVMSPEDDVFVYRGLTHFNATVRLIVDLKSQLNSELLESVLTCGIKNSIYPNLLITKSHLYPNWNESGENVAWNSNKDSVSPFYYVDTAQITTTDLQTDGTNKINNDTPLLDNMDGMSDGWQGYLEQDKY